MNEHRIRFHRRLAFQTGVAVALVTSLVFGTTGWVLVNDQERTLDRELTLRVLAQTQSLSLAAAAPLLRHDPELGLHPLIQKALKDHPELIDLVVVDRDGAIQGHRDLLQVGTRLSLQAPAPDDLVRNTDGQQAWVENDQLLISVPVRHLDQPIGKLVARASRDNIQATVAQSLRRLVTIAGAGTLSGILMVLFLVNQALRPMGPMREGVRKIGGGDLDARIDVKQTNELGLFADLINNMAAGLGAAQAELIQKERLDHELAIAHDLQSGLLPGRVEAPAGYQLAAHYTPALEVSGDYYDVIPQSDGSVALVVADVSGKGVPGLVVMAMLRVILRGLSAPDRSPDQVLASANRMLLGSIKKDMFITCIYGVFDPSGHSFTYVSAGHCRPVRWAENAMPQWGEAGGKPLAMFPAAIFEKSLKQQRVDLAPGDGLVMYTDGLIEAMNESGDQLGQDAVLKRVRRRAASAEDAVEGLRELVQHHREEYPATDDLTLLALRRDLVPAASPVSQGEFV